MPYIWIQQAVVAGAWSPSDGFVRPVTRYAGLAAAQARGEIRTGTAVTGIEQAPAGWPASTWPTATTCYTTDRHAPPGAWSQKVGEMVDVNLPITPHAARLPFTPRYHPTATGTVHHRPPRRRLPRLAGQWAAAEVGIPTNRRGFDTDVTTDWHDKLVQPWCIRTDLAGAFSHGWAGLYE